MSSEVYFDFMPFQLYKAKYEENDLVKFLQLREDHERQYGNSYASYRVAYLGELLNNSVIELWESFHERYSGEYLGSFMMNCLFEDWKRMYSVMKEEGRILSDCQTVTGPGDVLPPERIKELCTKHRGLYLHIRVD